MEAFLKDSLARSVDKRFSPRNGTLAILTTVVALTPPICCRSNSSLAIPYAGAKVRLITSTLSP